MMHLGPRVTALVDGQLSPAEEERAWAHVHVCVSCRAAVEREGWVKRQLANLSLSGHEVAPPSLKGSLRRPPTGLAGPSAGAWHPGSSPVSRTRRLGGLAVLGAGSAGAAMMGVIALGAAPAGTPVEDRRAPVTSLRTAPSAQYRPVGRDRDVGEAVRTLVSAFRFQ